MPPQSCTAGARVRLSAAPCPGNEIEGNDGMDMFGVRHMELMERLSKQDEMLQRLLDRGRAARPVNLTAVAA